MIVSLLASHVVNTMVTASSCYENRCSNTFAMVVMRSNAARCELALTTSLIYYIALSSMSDTHLLTARVSPSLSHEPP